MAYRGRCFCFIHSYLWALSPPREWRIEPIKIMGSIWILVIVNARYLWELGVQEKCWYVTLKLPVNFKPSLLSMMTLASKGMISVASEWSALRTIYRTY